ncbi:MAG: S-layer homology domain-containing protein, partial [Patescibacteria group bacterium]
TNPGTSDEDEVILTAEEDMPFTDVIGHWAEDYITELWTMGVVEGRTETLFFPDESLNRAEAAKIVALLFGYDVEDSVTVTSYPDVAADQWYAPYIEALSGEGVLEGYADGYFRPEQTVTRAEALKMALYAAGITVPEVADDAELPFTDLYGYEWYVDVVVHGVNLGVIEGYVEDDTFRPNNEVTRAEASKINLETYDL